MFPPSQPSNYNAKNISPITYAAPSLALAVWLLPLYMLAPTLLAQQNILSLTVLGFVFFTIRLWDGVVDPLIGSLIDIHPIAGRWRLGMMQYIGWPLVTFGVILLGLTPYLSWPLWTTLFGGLAITTGWSCVTIPYQALAHDLTHDIAQRQRLIGAREAAGIVGTMLTLLAVGYAASTGASLTLNQAAAQQWQIIFVIMLFACVWLIVAVWRLSCITPDRVITHKKEKTRQVKNIPWQQSWRTVWDNNSFRRLLLVYFVNGLANALPATLFVLFVTHVVKAPTWQGGFLLLYFVAALLGFPFWQFLCRYLPLTRVWILAMLLACIFFTICISLLWLPPADSTINRMIIYGFVCVATGFCLGADLVIPATLQTQAIDADTNIAEHPQRSGHYLGAWSVVTKLATASAIGLAFPLLQAMDCYAAQCNTPKALLTLLFFYAGLPILLKIIAMTLFQNLEMSKDKQL